MWDLVTEYVESLSLFAIYGVLLFLIANGVNLIYWISEWFADREAAREKARSHYVDPAYPRVATRSDAHVKSVVAATGSARGPYRVSRRPMELGVSPSGLDENSCFQTTGLSRPRGDAA